VGRPTILFQRVPVPASTQPTPGAPGAAVRTDSTFFSAPEAMEVDYIFVDTEQANSGDIVIRPYLHEREFWVETPVLPTTFNNLVRVADSEDYGEFWLAEPFLAQKGHGIGISIQNRIPDRGTSLIVMLHGYGRESGREYHLPFDCNMPLGTAAGVQRDFGGRGDYVAGREDIWITALTWARKNGNPEFPDDLQAWNPRLIGLVVKPGHGTRWSGPGGPGAGGSFVPLIVYSNIRGPQAACFYKPAVRVGSGASYKDKRDRGLVLEQNDVFGMEVFPYTPNNGANALIAVVGTTLAV
jgi:hypothetical protein